MNAQIPMGTDGRKRVVITNVVPQPGNGKYPAKTVTGEQLSFSADIFTDGHDDPDASLLLKHKNDRQWTEYPMKLINNDHWETSLKLTKTGIYQFRIQAWIDHFTTWKKGLRKKADAGQPLDIEFEIGSQLISAAILCAKAEDKKLLEKHLSRVRELQSSTEKQELIAFFYDDTLAAAMRRSVDKKVVTVYPLTLEIEAERPKAAFSTWYELFPRSASTEPGMHGTFKDVQKLLPRIAEMGFDVLYFPPIHPIGERNRKGKNNSLKAAPGEPGSPWAIGSSAGGHKSIHPQLGTLKDFKALVKAAREKGIDIAMDIAFQCAPDHPYVTEHPEWFRWRPDGTVQYAENPPKRYEDILPFNFETDDWQALWQELKSVIVYWIEQGVEIFRVDNPHTKSLAFWEWAIGSVRQQYPQIIFLAEAFTRPRIMEQLAMAGFNQSYTYFTWRTTQKEIKTYMHELTRTGMRYYYRPNFWPNTPDILPAELVYGGEQAHIMRLILAATLSSSYGIYGPVYEFGINTPYPGKEEYIDNEKYEIKHWDWNAETRIREIITRVNMIRKENKALQTTWNIVFAASDNDQIICYGKADEETGNRLLMVVNLDPHNTQSGYVCVPLQHLGLQPGQGYTLHDLLSGDTYRWEEEWNYVQLDPYKMPAHIFRIEQ